MVAGLGQAADDSAGAARVQGRVGHDFLKEGVLHEPGAGEGEKPSSGVQEPQGAEVDVLVASGRAVQAGLGIDEFGRVEHEIGRASCRERV